VETSAVAAFLVAIAAAGTAQAQLPMPPSTQFDVTGYIQEATLDSTCSADPHCGGVLEVEGHSIIIPKETVVVLPANQITWQEMFSQAPAPYGLAAVQANGAMGASGLALGDLPVPLGNYEAHVIGNRVLGGSGGPDIYIAGLVYISSHSLNTGAGFINFIDYAKGEMRVGGFIGDNTTGARVRLNDPSGEFGRINSPDIRFTVDPQNPTVMSGTGFPMCFPRTDPAVADDALCPQAQRPIAVAGNPPQFAATINMNDPRIPGLAGVAPDATVQAPFEVGDYIIFAGILATDNAAAPTAGPFPANGSAGIYISAWSITNNIGIWTAPGADPAYAMLDVTILGTGGLSVLGAGEAAFRTRFEGMTTDTGRSIHLYALDNDPLTGAVTDRDWGTIGVDPGPPTGAVRGRWRFRPPCAVFGTVPAKPAAQCVMNATGTFLPPPREVRVVIEGAWTPATPLRTAANGLIWGQYHAPITGYIFPENVPGTAIVPNNFNTFPFLAQGGYPSTTGVLPRQLNPWPDATVPVAGCTAPTVSAGGPYTVASGGTVPLAGSAAGSTPMTFAWTVSSGSLSSATTANTVFSAVGGTSPVTATLSATNACGSANSSATITINLPASPTVAQVAPVSVFSTAAGSFALSGTDPNVPAQALTFSVAQAGPVALVNLKVTSTGASTANVTFTAPALAAGTINPSVVNLTITATNAGGAVSAPATTTVTVKPLPDTISVTTAQFRISQTRLSLTVTSTVVSPSVTLTLQPYLTTTGTTFDPANLGNVLTNTGGGTYTLTLVGAPEPAISPAKPIVVKSNLGGTSLPTAITVR
jgi:hypothetical protein